MEMILPKKDLWEIVEGTEDAPPSSSDDKVKKAYERPVKKALSTIILNLVDRQVAHVRGIKSPVEAVGPWKCPTGRKMELRRKK